MDNVSDLTSTQNMDSTCSQVDGVDSGVKEVKVADTQLRKNSNSWSIVIRPSELTFEKDKKYAHHLLYCRKLDAGGKWNLLQCDFDSSKRLFNVPQSGSQLSFAHNYEFRFRTTSDTESTTSPSFQFCPIENYDPDLKLFFKQDRDNIIVHWLCTKPTEQNQGSSFVRTFFEADEFEFVIQYDKFDDDIPIERRVPSSCSHFVIARRDLKWDNKYNFRIALRNLAGTSIFTRNEELFPFTYDALDSPTVYADIKTPILRFNWKSFKTYVCKSYTVKWKNEKDIEWMECESLKKQFILCLEESALSFTDTYEIQVAANIEVSVDKDTQIVKQSHFSQSCRFVLSELFGTEINDLVERPTVSEIGFQSITIEWQTCPETAKYAVLCRSVSTAKSKVLYSQETRYSFKDLNENDLYEFQVAVSGSNGQTGVWSQRSYPVLPSLQLAIPLQILRRINEQSHVFTLNYDVTEFIQNIQKADALVHEIDHHFIAIKNTLQFHFETHDNGHLSNVVKNFAETLRDKLEEMRLETNMKIQDQIVYERINCIYMTDPNLNLGHPLKVKFGFEIVLNQEHIKAKYLGCQTINNKTTSTGDGTHLFDILINESQSTSKESDSITNDYSNEVRSEHVNKMNSNELLKQFQQDIIRIGECTHFECNHLKLLGFHKHEHGIYGVATYKIEGLIDSIPLLIDLTPIVRLPKLSSPGAPCPAIFNNLGPTHQTERYMDLIGYSCSETDLFLLSGTYLIPGAWRITSFNRDNEVLKRLPTKARKAFAIAMYIIRMYIMENTMAIDNSDPHFSPVLQDEEMDGIDFKAMFGLKSVISPDILKAFVMQLISKSRQRKEEADLTEARLVLCMFDMLKTVVDSGKGDEVAIGVKNEAVKRLSYRFDIKHISQIEQTVRKLADPGSLKQVLASFTCTSNVPAGNWPVVEGAIKVHSLMTNTAVPSSQELKPRTSVIGFRTLVVRWNDHRQASEHEYAINCINKSTGKTYIRYTQQTQMEFYHLNQNDTYEFQVAECGNDGKGIAWSKKSFPVKPIMQLDVNLGTVWPSKGHGRQRTYNLNYGVTDFICTFKESNGPNVQESIFARLSEKLRIDYATYDKGLLKVVLEKFVNIFCDEMTKQNAIYEGMKHWECGSLFANLRVGRPLEADIALELVLDENLLKVEYFKCIDINSKATDDEGTHLFFMFTKEQKFKDPKDSNPETYFKIRSDKILRTFQNDVEQCRQAIHSKLYSELSDTDVLKDKLDIIGFKMHRRGVCAVLKYKTHTDYEGLLVDLVPILRLPNIHHPKYPSRLMYDVHAPRYQADRYREAMACESCLKTDLFLLNELDEPYNQLDGAWSLSTSSIDHEILKLLHDDVKHAFRVVKFILQMYIVENRQEIANGNDFFQIKKHGMGDAKLKQIYGLKSALPSHLLQILLIQLMVQTHQRMLDQDIFSDETLIYCLFDILKRIVDSGNGRDVWFEAKKEMENRTSCGFELRNVFQLRKMVQRFANQKELKMLVDNLFTRDTVPLVNWPLLEGAIQIELETRSAEDITKHGKGITSKDDIIGVNYDKEYSVKERTVYLKQPLDGSWIVCAVVKEIGDGEDKNQPIILGICRMRDKGHFEKLTDIEDIRNETDTIWLNLRDLEVEGIAIRQESVIETKWQEYGQKGIVNVTLQCAYGFPPVEYSFETNNEKDYISFMILPHGMKLQCEARQCLNERPEDDEDGTDDNVRTGFENAKRFLGLKDIQTEKDMKSGMEVVRLPVIAQTHPCNITHVKLGNPPTDASQKTKDRTVLFIGRSGTGKSTFVDAICNFIFDTKWEERTRLCLVGESCASSDCMNIYTIYSGESNRIPYTLNVIDTPGLSDKSDSEQYQRFFDQISSIRNLPGDTPKSINAICFFVKASGETDFKEHAYIMDYLTSIFETEISSHLLLIATFANPEKVSVQKYMVDSGIKKFRGNILKFDNSLIFASNTCTHEDSSSGIGNVRSDKTSYLKTYWKMGKDRLRHLLNDVSDIEVMTMKSDITSQYERINGQLIKLENSILEHAREMMDVRKEIIDLTNALKAKAMSTIHHKSIESRGKHCQTCQCIEHSISITQYHPISRPPLPDEKFSPKPVPAYLELESVSVNTRKRIGGALNMVTFGMLNRATGVVSEIDEEDARLRRRIQQHEESEKQRKETWEKEQAKKRNDILQKHRKYTEERDRCKDALKHHRTLYSDKTNALQNAAYEYRDKWAELHSIPPYPDQLSYQECINKIKNKVESLQIAQWEGIVFELEHLGSSNYESICFH